MWLHCVLTLSKKVQYSPHFQTFIFIHGSSGAALHDLSHHEVLISSTLWFLAFTL